MRGVYPDTAPPSPEKPSEDTFPSRGPGAPDLVVSPDLLSSRWYVRADASMDQARLACGEIQPLARAGAPAGEAESRKSGCKFAKTAGIFYF